MIRTIPDLVAFLNAFKTENAVDWAFSFFIGEPATAQYITWIDLGDTPLAADNVAYFSQPMFALELHSKQTRSFTTEQKLADALTASGTYYRRLPAEFISSEGVWMTPFYI